MKVACSILSVLDQNLDTIIKTLEDAQVDYLHLDVMDNKFVPNYTFDEQFVSKIKAKTSLTLDTHLMIKNPLQKIDSYLKTKSDFLCFHLEATRSPQKIIDKIKEASLRVGIAIKPKTDVKKLIPYLKDLDLILVMSVEPGFGGQKFQEEVLEKVTYLKKMKEKFAYKYLIEMDGGINPTTAELAKKAGCDVIVVGTYLFQNGMLSENLERLKAI